MPAAATTSMHASLLLLLAAGAHAFHGRRADIVYSRYGYHEVTTVGGCAAEGLNDVLDLSQCTSAASTLNLAYTNTANSGSYRPYGCSVNTYAGDSYRRRRNGGVVYFSDNPESVQNCSVAVPCVCQDDANPPFVPPPPPPPDPSPPPPSPSPPPPEAPVRLHSWISDLWRESRLIKGVNIHGRHSHGAPIPPISTYFASMNSSTPYFEPSRPNPLSFIPPKGATSVAMMPSLQPTSP